MAELFAMSNLVQRCCVVTKNVVVLPILVILTTLNSFSSATGGELLVKYQGLDRDTYTIRTVDTGNFNYVTLHDLAEALDARTYYSSKAKKVILYLGTSEIKVTAFNSFVVIGDRVRQIPIEVIYNRGDILVPLHFFVDLLADYYNGKIEFDEESETLLISPDVANILGVTVEEKANGTLIRIATARPFDESDVYTSLSDANWLYVDIYGGKVDAAKDFALQTAGVVKEVYTTQLSPETARVSFKLRGKPTKRETHVAENGGEIMISLPTRESISEEILADLKAEREKWHIDTVVIDPGHGGRDPGAIGPTGLYEKDVTLAIAKELRKLLEKNLGVKVCMTRDKDSYPTLKDRTKDANQHNGKLFISIHTNSNRSSRVSGFTVYFLGQAKTEEALDVARLENSVIKEYENSTNGYGDLSDQSFILAAMAQNTFNKESQDLAALIAGGLDGRLKTKNRGVEQAGFYVLIGASMPNVLVETGFISNRQEEKLLRQDSYRKKIAAGIFDGIKAFKDRYESLI